MTFRRALVLSVGVHVVLAAALALALRLTPGPDRLAELDLSSVELSFAEEVSETEPAFDSLPPVSPSEPQPERRSEPPDVPAEFLDETPPEPEAMKLAEVEPEPPPEMVTPEIASSPVPVAAPRQAKVDAPPAPVKTIRPEYPKGARQRGESGDVTLEIAVDERGRVTGVSVLASTGFRELDEAAVRAVRTVRFRPASSRGLPVASSARLTLSFRLTAVR